MEFQFGAILALKAGCGSYCKKMPKFPNCDVVEASGSDVRHSIELSNRIAAPSASCRRRQEKDHLATGRIDRQIDFESGLVALQPRIAEIREFARSRRTLSPRAGSALDKVQRLKFPLTKAETNALRELFKILAEKGMDLSVR